MAVTQLADVTIVPSVFSENMILRSLNRDAFIQSGVATVDSMINDFLNGPQGGRKIELRFMGPLKDDEENISNDNPNDKSTPYKVTGVTNSAVRQSLNNSWSSMDLVADLNGRDPLDVVELQLADYWRTVRQRRALASVKGVILDSKANHDSDMLVDLSENSGADAFINADAIIDARNTMGDRDNEIAAMAVHSTVRATMRKMNLIDSIPYSRGEISFESYLGLPLIVDDGLTVDVDADTGNKLYYTYFFARGALGLGYGSPKVPYEVVRDPAAGNGGGQETVHSRVEWVIHPQGYRFDLDKTPSRTELADPDNWTRAWERKRIPLAAIISKG